MKIVLDNNVPAYVGRLLAGFEYATAYQRGWHHLANGQLLGTCEAAGFDLLITLDRGFLHQQNLSGRKIRIAVLIPTGQGRLEVETAVKNLLSHIHELKPGSATEIRAEP